MTFIKITLNGPKASYTYNGYYVPCTGDVINFTFANVVGTVHSVTWEHLNEVVLVIK